MPNTSGLHLVRKRLKSGDRWYVYAHRGGPVIHVQDGARPPVTPVLLAKAQQALGTAPRDSLDRIIDAYRASPEFADKAAATQREYRARLDQISYKFGAVPLRLIPELGPEIIKWRDSMASTPRAADRCVGMLHTVLRWGKQRGMWRGENPASDMPKLHRVNRADLIWEARHWEAVKDAPGYIRRVLVLGSLTGLRVSDLLALTWEHLHPGYISLLTGKSRHRTEAIIPLYPELARFFTGPGMGVVLRNSRGRPWTADGWQSSWGKVQPAGFDRHLHDLRGTFATRLMAAGFSDVEIAAVMGWGAERIAAIRSRYVDRGRVAKALAERLFVNPPVNRFAS